MLLEVLDASIGIHDNLEEHEEFVLRQKVLRS